MCNSLLENYWNGDVVCVQYKEPGKDVATYRGTVVNNRLAKDGCRILTLQNTVQVDNVFVDKFNSFRADRVLYISTAGFN